MKTERAFTVLEVLLGIILAVGAGLCAGASGSVVLGVGVGLVVAALIGFALAYLAQLQPPKADR
jgi:hypothetical protein